VNRISFRSIGGCPIPLLGSEVPPTRFCTPCCKASECHPLHSVSQKNRLQIGSCYTENKTFSLSVNLDCLGNPRTKEALHPTRHNFHICHSGVDSSFHLRNNHCELRQILLKVRWLLFQIQSGITGVHPFVSTPDATEKINSSTAGDKHRRFIH
jgi:hypothetical protein